MEHGKSNLTAKKMRTLFSELNDLLIIANKQVKLVLCDGAVMVMVGYGIRDMTDDIW
jgi:predicted metal-dependent peptidase